MNKDTEILLNRMDNLESKVFERIDRSDEKFQTAIDDIKNNCSKHIKETSDNKKDVLGLKKKMRSIDTRKEKWISRAITVISGILVGLGIKKAPEYWQKFFP